MKPALILLVVLFAYQLYCDFSGYSDIAVGAALFLGCELTENFNRPYAARSIGEFFPKPSQILVGPNATEGSFKREASGT